MFTGVKCVSRSFPARFSARVVMFIIENGVLPCTLLRRLAIKLRTHLERAAHRKPNDPGMPLMKKSVNPCHAASYKRLERKEKGASGVAKIDVYSRLTVCNMIRHHVPGNRNGGNRR